MEVWIGLIGLAGVIVGGFMTAVTGHFQSKSADRRLKTQLDHEAGQRKEASILSVKLDAVSSLETMIERATEAMPLIIGRPIPDAIMDPLITDIQRAFVSALATGDEQAFEALIKIRDALVGMMERKESDSETGIGDLNYGLATLKKRCIELKLRAISS